MNIHRNIYNFKQLQNKDSILPFKQYDLGLLQIKAYLDSK